MLERPSVGQIAASGLHGHEASLHRARGSRYGFAVKGLSWDDIVQLREESGSEPPKYVPKFPPQAFQAV